MAFENLFSGIDFQAGNRMALAQQQQMQQAIGQGMAQYNAQQDREMKQRQMEQEAGKLDLGQAAQEALFKQSQGIPLTQQETAAINAFSTLKGAPMRYVPDPLNPGSLRAIPGQTLAQRSGLVEQQPQVPQMYGLPPGAQGIAPDPRTTIDGAQVMPINQAQMNAALSGGGQSPLPPPPISPSLVTADQFAAAKLPPSPRYEGSLAQDIEAGEADVGVKEHLIKYRGEKEINSVFEGQKLGQKSLAQQNKYEDSLKIMLDGYKNLITEGAAVQTLSKDSDWGDVLQNISAAVSSTGVGQKIAGAAGTRAQAARESMNRVLPLMFGSLRGLLGMTGKELDTPKEKEFYMKALPSAGVSIGSNLDNIEELSNRFGNSETAAMVQEVRDLLSKEPKATGEWSIKRK